MSVDVDDVDNLTRYMAEIEDYERFSLHDEREMFARIEAGDEDARRQIIESHLRLVINIASRFQYRTTLPLDDIIQEGNLGLLHAVKKFDRQKGYRFSTYATWWIKQACGRAVTASRLVQLPLGREGLATQLYRTADEIAQERGVLPDIMAAALRCGVDPVIAMRIWRTQSPPLSLDATYRDCEHALGDAIPSEDDTCEEVIEREETICSIRDALYELPWRERVIIVMRYGLGNRPCSTLRETAIFLKLSTERVRQLQQHAEATLKKILEADVTLSDLGT